MSVLDNASEGMCAGGAQTSSVVCFAYASDGVCAGAVRLSDACMRCMRYLRISCCCFAVGLLVVLVVVGVVAVGVLAGAAFSLFFSRARLSLLMCAVCCA